MRHLNVAPVVVGQVEEVEGEADPEVKTRHPHEDGVLKALGEVGVAGVPRDIPLLQTQTQVRGQRDAPTGGRGRHGVRGNTPDPYAPGPLRQNTETGSIWSQKDKEPGTEE